MSREEKGRVIRTSCINSCQMCPLKSDCTTGKERSVRRWEREDVLDRAQAKINGLLGAMQQRRETVEHPFGTIKAWMGATHFKMKTLAHVATEMAVHVLAYNIKRVIAILGVPELIKGIARFLLLLAIARGSEVQSGGPIGRYARVRLEESRELRLTGDKMVSEARRWTFSHGLV